MNEETRKKCMEFDNNVKKLNTEKESEIMKLIENPKFYINPSTRYKINYEHKNQIYCRSDMESDTFDIVIDFCKYDVLSEIFNALKPSMIHMNKLNIEIFHSDPRTGISFYREHEHMLKPILVSVYEDIPKIICDKLKVINLSGITLKLTFEYHYVNPYL